MSMSKPRLVADPAIGVSDLIECLEKYMNDQGSNNLYKLLDPPPHVTWKTAPDHNWLCAHSELWKLYLAKATNGVLPANKQDITVETPGET